jgi:hypothetical protein
MDIIKPTRQTLTHPAASDNLKPDILAIIRVNVNEQPTEPSLDPIMQLYLQGLRESER